MIKYCYCILTLLLVALPMLCGCEGSGDIIEPDATPDTLVASADTLFIRAMSFPHEYKIGVATEGETMEFGAAFSGETSTDWIIEFVCESEIESGAAIQDIFNFMRDYRYWPVKHFHPVISDIDTYSPSQRTVDLHKFWHGEWYNIEPDEADSASVRITFAGCPAGRSRLLVVELSTHNKIMLGQGFASFRTQITNQ